MLYKYRGMNQNGKSVRGTITASSLDEAKNKLRVQKIYYKSLEETRQLSVEAFSKRQMPGTLLSSTSKELSSYLNSGMTILTALKLMENQHENEKKYASFLNAVRTMVDEGKSLYVALNSQKIYSMPDFFLQSLKVAGQSGKMVEVLKNMSHFFSAQNRIKKQVSNAMVYPIVIFVIAIGMSGFLITSVVPKIVGIFEDTGNKLPEITQFVLGISDFLTAHYIALLLGFIIFAVLFKISYAKWTTFTTWIDSILLKTPIFGSLIQNHELGRFSYILSLMLDSGVSYAQAVQLASTTFSNRAMKKTFDAASTKVLEGNKLSNALYMVKGFKPKRNFLQSLALGEESSEVASILFNISDLYSEENEDKIKLLLSLMEPLMMIFIGLVVGVIVVAMLLPIFTMSSNF